MNQIWEELPKLSDGIAVLILGAWLDRFLEEALKVSFIKTIKDDDLLEIFGSGGPLETSGQKLRMAFALGVMGKKTRSAIDKIQKIRNLFAHSPIYLDFSTPEVKARCMELNITKEYNSSGNMSGMNMEETGEGPREKFMDSCASLEHLSKPVIQSS